MRFVTFAFQSYLYGAVEHDGKYVRLNDLGQSAELQFFVRDGVHKLGALRDALQSFTGKRYDPAEVKLHPPLRHVGMIACTGLNYRRHAEESGMEPPSEPVWFNKLPRAIAGPGNAIVLPRQSTKVDYEAELVLVIGREGYCIPEGQALDYIFGCMCGHDVSERDWQLNRPAGQWWLGKTSPTFAPI